MLKFWITGLAGFLIAAYLNAPVKGAVTSSTPAAPATVYQAKCSFCHTPKPAAALPDLKSWIKLLYTSGCPEVTIQLDENQRKAIKALMELEFKAPKK